MAQQPLVGRGPLIEVSRSHSDTPKSVGLLWTSDKPDSETSTRQHPVGFEPTILANERPQAHALAAQPLGTAFQQLLKYDFKFIKLFVVYVSL
jgi:hypothetical protein